MAKSQRQPPLTIVPSLLWLAIFFICPLVIVLIYSFLKKGVYGGLVFDLTFENYTRAWDWIYLRIFWESLKIAVATTLSCLLLGFPTAYVMATAKPYLRNLLAILLMLPFLTNMVVRTYAIKVLLADQGPLNDWGMRLHLWSEPLALSNSYLAVWFGMVTNYLPFMVLPLYVSMEKFDFTLFEAARDLGASGWHTFRRIFLPLTMPGILTGSVLVFTPSLGEFLIPDVLGGARTMLVGSLITEQFLKMRDWPFGSALSILLMVFVLITIPFAMRESKERHAR